MSVLSLTSTAEEGVSSGMEWDSANQRKIAGISSCSLVRFGWCGCALPVVSVCVQEQRVPPNPSLAGCALTPWTQAVLHFWFHKAAARLGEEVRTFKIKTSPSKIKAKIQKQGCCFILLFPSALAGSSFPRADCQCGLQGPISAGAMPQPCECIPPADLNTALKA